jgi:hypothetical protein
MKTVPTILGILFVLLLSGCWDNRTSKQEMLDAENVDKQQQQYAKTQPIPFFDYSRERQVYVQIYQARNRAVATHSVWRGDMSVIEGDCPSIGFPIPYDVQLSNPLKIAQQYIAGGYANGIVEQPEPNGLYSSKTTSATWVMCVVLDQGMAKIVPVYVEGKVTAYPYPVKVDYEKNRVVKAEDASPSVVITERNE